LRVIAVLTRPSPTANTRQEAARQRRARYRERVRQGRACCSVEFDGEVLSFLIRHHWLSEAEASDPQAVGRAIGEVIADAARG
jgi:hypothetical protein